MSTPLFHKVTTNHNIRKEIYQQFCLDAKRMSVFIDGQYDHSISEKCLYTWLVNRFKNEKKGLWFAYWCTQTALADIYQEKVKLLNQNHLHSLLSLSTTPVHSKSYSTCEPVDYHLLDDGRQRIYIKLSDIQKDNAIMHVFKPFRVCYMYHERLRTLYYIHLSIYVDTYTLGTYKTEWIRFDSPTSLDVHQKTIIQDDDTWFIVS